jgi:hypothetical protein
MTMNVASPPEEIRLKGSGVSLHDKALFCEGRWSFYRVAPDDTGVGDGVAGSMIVSL